MVPIRIPASAGPATRASVWTDVCRATAPTRSASPTRVGRAARRAGQSVPCRAALRRSAHEQRPHRGVSGRRVEGQAADGCGHRHLCADEHTAAVGGVGQCAAPERSGDERDELDNAHEADDEGRVGEPEGLIRDGHDGELRAHARHDLAGPQSSKVPVPPKRRDVEDKAGHAETVTVSHRSDGGDRRTPFWVNEAVINPRTGGNQAHGVISYVGNHPDTHWQLKPL